MDRISHILGKPIISAQSGDKLGSVSDALLDAAQIRIVALVVGGGLLGEERVLPFGDVQTLGGDTVVVRSSELIGARQWRESGAQTIRSSHVTGKPVVTVTGRRTGTVSDLLIDRETGALAALEIGQSDLGGLRKKRSQVHVSPEMRIGPDAVVVPDTAAGETAVPEAEPRREVETPERDVSEPDHQGRA